ncbi:chemoreceptor glutamine deamidase CheD [Alteromonas sp. a30]|uniref:chemoreceptor glutamine deamidase CheD n=1 Tax=Alteromonas sp. a30 TaxID=2730917 RepID=UPI00227E0B8F|nr:chemoreceptor glutamine deamidase CheD [Alteromonas sp. a30]MCY7295378.1 chemoreceptor glutamine deamidase CheD [Alteromonas sp. a30]
MLNSSNSLPLCLPGFEHINRYFDRQNKSKVAKILPGEYYVTKENEVITTVLGSCISVCVSDPTLGIGGMNHFMLPSGSNMDLLSDSFRYGDVAMERLVNDILRNGGDKNRLVFKAFGGGQIIKNMTSIGQRNISFLHKFMTMEGYKLAASDLGGPHPRKVMFFPLEGTVKVKRLQHMHNDTILARENRYKNELSKQEEVAGDIDLFD